MKCPGCGAALSSSSVQRGDCEYCGTALPKPKAEVAPPPVIHVTHIEVSSPEPVFHVRRGRGARRAAGCFSGCLSAGVSIAITGMILAFVAWNLWVQTRNLPSPTPAPPAADHGRSGRRK